MPSLNNPYLVESRIDGNNWYKLFSDGTIVQGGNINTPAKLTTVNFLKPMESAEYSVQTTLDWTTTGQNGVFSGVYGNKTTTSVQVAIIGRTGQTGVAFYWGWVSWEVKGKIANV